MTASFLWSSGGCRWWSDSSFVTSRHAPRTVARKQNAPLHCSFASTLLCLLNSFCLLGIIYQQNINFMIFNKCLVRNNFTIKIIWFNEECGITAVPQIVGAGRGTFNQIMLALPSYHRYVCDTKHGVAYESLGMKIMFLGRISQKFLHSVSSSLWVWHHLLCLYISLINAQWGS